MVAGDLRVVPRKPFLHRNELKKEKTKNPLVPFLAGDINKGSGEPHPSLVGASNLEIFHTWLFPNGVCTNRNRQNLGLLARKARAATWGAESS